MNLDVIFTPLGLQPHEVLGRPVLVVDILRTTTVICAALHHGARGILPVASAAEASRLAQTLGSADVLLAGERNSEPIEGFHLGNSPLAMKEETVGGKTLIMATTNGTGALLAAQGGSEVYVAAAANLSAAGARAREILETRRNLVILCAGRESRFGLDDAYTAGRLAIMALGGRRRRKGLNDAALCALDLVRRYGDRWERPLAYSAAGRQLAALRMGDDVADAARQDAYPVLPVFRDRRITIEGA